MDTAYISHSIANVETVRIPKELQYNFDAVGIEQLEEVLRHRIDAFLETRHVVNARKRKGSYQLIADATGISQSFVVKFHRNERTVCIQNLNKLAAFFNVKYVVTNFPVGPHS